MEKRRGLARVIGDVGLGAFGLLLGAAVFLLFQSATGGASDAGAEAPLVFDAPAAGAGAASPDEAVRAFLDAETAGNAAAAFGLLSEADRIANTSAELWSSRSPLGQIRSWNWVDSEALVTAVALEPSLSLTQGWSPASASFTWNTVNEDGWRISLADSSFEPERPDPSTAVDAAASWSTDPSRCSSADDPRLVLATPSSAFDQLCSVGGVVLGDQSAPVAGRVAAELELSYGPGASNWARSVSLEGGVDLILVALADDWVVIDAVAR